MKQPHSGRDVHLAMIIFLLTFIIAIFHTNGKRQAYVNGEEPFNYKIEARR